MCFTTYCGNAQGCATLTVMSQMPNGAVPTWDEGDRLAKALRHAGMSNSDMASYMGVHRNTISSYVNGRAAVDRRTRLLWAMKTGVSIEWLEDGAGEPPTPGPGVPQSNQLARLTEMKRSRSRQQPTRKYLRRAPALAEAA